jgi:transcription antitermination protein NusB
MKGRARARAWALQALYAWEMRGDERVSPIRAFHDLVGEMRISPEHRTYAEALLRLYSGNFRDIDGRLRDLVTNWRLERLSTIDRCVLRLGAAEMIFVDDVPARVTIREFVRIAERYGTPESPRFVNGVLDGLMRSLEEVPGGDRT